MEPTAMPSGRTAAWLADAVLIAHVGIVAFVVGGLVAVWVGAWRRWRWADAPAFRVAHALAIGVVVAQAWLGVHCPLTWLEVWLRRRAGEAGFDDSFIGHWLQRLLYVDAPPWAFVVAYTAFALLVAWTWWRWPPRRRGGGRRGRR
jgi:polyferredoxin